MNTTPSRVPVKEFLKSIPEVFGIRLNEEPDYQVLEADHDYLHGDVEIRRYPALVLAQVEIAGQGFESYQEPAFKALADYIFGNNREKRTLEMTAPVLQERTERGWRMSFILPREITIGTAPIPREPKIKLVAVAPRTVATLRYSGNNSERKMRDSAFELAKWLNIHGKTQSTEGIWWAQYDAPHTVPFLKRNEAHALVPSG